LLLVKKGGNYMSDGDYKSESSEQKNAAYVIKDPMSILIAMGVMLLGVFWFLYTLKGFISDIFNWDLF